MHSALHAELPKGHDFLLQHLQAGLSLAIDDAVDVVHLRELSRQSAPPWLATNKAYFEKKWHLAGKHIAWGEYTEWRSPTDYTVGLVRALGPHHELWYGDENTLLDASGELATSSGNDAGSSE